MYGVFSPLHVVTTETKNGTMREHLPSATRMFLQDCSGGKGPEKLHLGKAKVSMATGSNVYKMFISIQDLHLKKNIFIFSNIDENFLMFT